MQPLFSRSLVCFYCGGKSAKKYSTGLRDWTCHHCDATNYLDRNGDIAEPPASSSSRERKVKYAQQLPRLNSPGLSGSSESLFCRTCINNQRLLTESLASYLPPPSDPKYHEYEKEYPNYRQRLEQQYPQVCSSCEPRIREQIRASGYAAKTDHLRRLMDRTRHGRIREPWGWKHLALHIGRLAWWTSFGVQVSWHSIGCVSRINAHGLKSKGGYESITTCAKTLLGERMIESECVSMSVHLAEISLIASLLSYLWIPRWRERLDGDRGSLVGLSDYYKLQGIIFAARALAWFILGSVGLTVEASRTTHALFLVFFSLTAFVSSRTVKIDHTPLFVSHGLEDELPSNTGPDCATSAYQSPPDSQASGNEPTWSHNFPINTLSETVPEPLQAAYNPPTPPPEDDVDAMDWTPSQRNLELAPSKNLPHNLPGYVHLEADPFNTRIPAAPMSQEARQRNPYLRKDAEVQQTERQQRGFIGRLGAAAMSPSNLGSKWKSTRGGTDMNFAPVRLVLPASTVRQDTGLEKFFDNAFSLSDRPAELRRRAQIAASGSGQGVIETAILSSDAQDLVYTIAVLGSTVFWFTSSLRPEIMQTVSTSALVLLAIVSLLASIMQLKRASPISSLMKALQGISSLVLAWRYRVATDIVAREFVTALSTMLLILSCIYTLYTCFSSEAPAPSGARTMAQSSTGAAQQSPQKKEQPATAIAPFASSLSSSQQPSLKPTFSPQNTLAGLGNQFSSFNSHSQQQQPFPTKSQISAPMTHDALNSLSLSDTAGTAPDSSSRSSSYDFPFASRRNRKVDNDGLNDAYMAWRSGGDRTSRSPSRSEVSSSTATASTVTTPVVLGTSSQQDFSGGAGGHSLQPPSSSFASSSNVIAGPRRTGLRSQNATRRRGAAAASASSSTGWNL